jgi:hypothetical protein
MSNFIEFIKRFLFSAVSQSYQFKILTIALITFVVYYYVEKIWKFDIVKKLILKLDNFDHKKYKLGIIVFAITFLYLSLWQIFRHYRFGTYGLDFGLFSQSLRDKKYSSKIENYNVILSELFDF